jgi:DNA-binding HxlR family transcriptional regulator
MVGRKQESGQMVRRTSHRKADCAVARTLDVVGDGWSLLIVRDAFAGLTRFGEFQKSLGLAKNILSARLRDLVQYGVFKVVPSSDGSSYNAYVLTEKGLGLRPVLVALGEWGEKFFLAAGDDLLPMSGQSYPRSVRAESSRSRSKRAAAVSL